jgi:Family of unknown function (DUF6152)
MKIRSLLAVAIFAGAFSGLALAHHSTAGYDMKKTSTLKGTVAQWIWRNPHCILVWDVKDESGKVTRWSGEMQSPISNTGFGLNRDSFKPGDELIVTAHPGPNGQALVLTISDAQGKAILDRYGEEGAPGGRAERAERNEKK